MALVVEDGSGLSTANAYISVADADLYHAMRGNTDWDALDDDVKASSILKATDYIQGTYLGRWKGMPSKATQALDWPRAYVERVEYAALTFGSLWYDNDVIPDQLKRATAELALRASVAELSPDLGRTTSKEGVGSLQVEYEPGSREQKAYQVVQGLLSRFLKGTASGMVPLVRT